MKQSTPEAVSSSSSLPDQSQPATSASISDNNNNNSKHLTSISAVWSRYFEVGGYDCRLLLYPKGDSQALPGYISVYLQIMDPTSTSSSKWDCFVSYRLAIVNLTDESKTIHRDSWHRSPFKNDAILITADILIFNETVNLTPDTNDVQSSLSSMISSSVVSSPVSDVLSGKFIWKGSIILGLACIKAWLMGRSYLSMCLESKDTEKMVASDRSCWCLFRMSVLNQKPGSNPMHKDSYGRFAADNKSGDNTSLGWNDYTRMSDFVGLEAGFLVDDTAVFSTSFHVIKEFSSFSKNGGLISGRSGSSAMEV
ncbi:hypothetical protein F3Y22_tig00111402pilonHSYRG00101 [Hibiscus syriacus]|uniref:MATH domain-containing protein n=1 Tax=Hibiscus syriacus TaxID=106335 RepID=A0A6A2Y952_HIBSY|nr:hypothetical protein F3Y22_tig00111402pilonHSYRG00101 [Hibiscus syriacus]